MSGSSLKEMGVVIAVSYTTVSLLVVFLEWFQNGGIAHAQRNLLIQFGFTVLFVSILYLQRLFESVSPLVLGLVQLVVAESLVMLFVYVSSLFVEVHPDGYRDMFVSTLIPFVCGGLIYYAVLYYQVRQNNRLLKQINAVKNKD